MNRVNGVFDSCNTSPGLTARILCLNVRNQVPRSSYVVPAIIYLLEKGNIITQPRILGRRAETVLL